MQKPFEPENDVPGTTPITILGGGYYIGGTGNATVDQFDFITVTIEADGFYSPVLYWNSGQDMDLYLYDENLVEICHSWYSNPEDECGSVQLSAGTYFIEVQDYSEGTFDTTYRFEMFDDN